MKSRSMGLWRWSKTAFPSIHFRSIVCILQPESEQNKNSEWTVMDLAIFQASGARTFSLAGKGDTATMVLTPRIILSYWCQTGEKAKREEVFERQIY